MSDFKTVQDFVRETGLSIPTVTNLLKDVTPEVTLGRTRGYHKDAIRSALVNKHKGVLSYLGVLDAALDTLHGHGSE